MVADEIKDLANRVLSQTKEIPQVVKGLEESVGRIGRLPAEFSGEIERVEAVS